MSIVQAFRIGFAQVRQAKRMILFAWIVNLALALTVAFPLINLLDETIATTVYEERLLEGMDANWFNTFRARHPENPLVRSFDYTITGAAPFLAHYETVLSGTMVKAAGNFLIDLILRWRVSSEYLGPLTILTVLSVLAYTFLAGAFIGSFARNFRVTFQEFLMEGARYFGRFFRLSLVSLLLLLVLFEWILDPWAAAIPAMTANAPSEWTPFVHYMIRNGVVLLLLGFVTMCFDYAKIRMVVDDRFSALFASWAGVRFVARYAVATCTLYVLLALAGLALIAAYALLQSFFEVSGYWSMLLLFLLQQAYLAGRLGVRALAFASQMQWYRSHTGTGG